MKSIGILGIIAVLLGLVSPARAQTHPDFTGLWRPIGLGRQILTVDGQSPPLLPGVRKAVPDDNEHNSCAAPGTPRIFFEPGSFLIVERPYQALFLFEYQRLFRRVFMRQLPGEIDPTFMGYSLGHWEGDTLVVETGTFNTETTLDRAGTPHSDALQLTERLRLANPTTLIDLMTVEDPKTFVRPWQTRFEFTRQPGMRIEEDACPDRIAATPHSG